MLVTHGEKGWVDNVYVTESLASGRLVRVMVRSHKVPEVGDKFVSTTLSLQLPLSRIRSYVGLVAML